MASLQILAKCEHLNPGGSIKDRIAKPIVDDAAARGVLRPGMTLVELSAGSATSSPRYLLIVGEHADPAEADATLARLEVAGFVGRVGYGTTRPGAYTIQLPDFASRAAAEATFAAVRGKPVSPGTSSRPGRT